MRVKEIKRNYQHLWR
nr:truncated env protein [Human immunodeficiency virus 1]